MGFPGGSDGKESTCNVGDVGSIPGLGRSHREGHGSILAWRMPIDRGAWQTTVHAGTESGMTETRHSAAAQNYKLLDKNIGIDLCDFGLCKTFLDMTPKSQMTKERIDTN